MKNFDKILVSFFLLWSFSSDLSAQQKQLDQASKDYQGHNYVDAIKVYLKVAERGFESEELFTKLANSYYFNAKYDEAVKWYNRLFVLNPSPQEPLLLLRYSQSLRATGDDTLAKKFYDQYVSKTSIDPNARHSIDYMALIKENSGRYELKPVAGLKNDKQISYGSTVFQDKLIYTSTAKEAKSFRNTLDAWDGLSFMSLYEIEIDNQGQTVGKPEKIKDLNSKYHESSLIYTKDGNTIYFTRTNINPKNKKEDQNLKIYRSKKKDEKWQEPEELSINGENFSTAHPALNPEENLLFFASNRPGGFGETDLYVSEIAEDGSLGEPKNLGPKINTSGRETFPFITKENELYFSSDGHFGLGGLDVFYIKMNDGDFGNLLNVGEPVNTYADDFAFGIDTESKRGFVSSNRSDKKGTFVYDNIYTFSETSPIVDLYIGEVEGTISDVHTEKPLENVTVTFLDPDGNPYVSVTTDKNGHYKAEINKYTSYAIRTNQDEYDADEKITKPNLDKQRVDFTLQRSKDALKPGTNLADVLNIPMIYFDFDKADIREDARVELEKLFAVLEEYPDLKINIRSHTDSRGSDPYNLSLSKRRAKSTLEYIVMKGVAPHRLKSEGLGETELINHCANEIPCSEEEHEKNRRSEFIIW